MMMLVSYDPAAGATYIQLSTAPVARTVSLSDLVMVDLDTSGHIVGIEFAVAPTHITHAMIRRVTDHITRG